MTPLVPLAITPVSPRPAMRARVMAAILGLGLFVGVAGADEVRKREGAAVTGVITDITYESIIINMGAASMPVKLSDLASPNSWTVDVANTDARLISALRAFDEAQFDKALTGARDVAQQKSGSRVDQQRAYELWAKAAISKGDKAQAILALEGLRKSFEQSFYLPWGLETLGTLYLDKQDLSGARSAFEGLQKIPGQEQSGQVLVAFILLKQKKWAEALSALRGVVNDSMKEKQPGLYARARAGMGLCEQKTNNASKAFEYYQEAVSFQAFDDKELKAHAHAGMGDHYWSQGNFKQAQRHYLWVVVLYQREAPPEVRSHVLCRSALCFEKLKEGPTQGGKPSWELRKKQLLGELEAMDAQAAKNCK